MGKFMLFGLLFWLTGNPFISLILIIILLYVLDRRFVGIFPSITKPFRTRSRLRKIKQELKLNPHHTSLKTEAARIYLNLGKYGQAVELLDEVLPARQDSADVWFESGLCRLKLKQLEEGESMILKALEMNPRTGYGEPYLRLGEAYASFDRGKALNYLRQFGEIQSSSCEAYYRLGTILQKMGRKDESKQAFSESLNIYRSLPRYKRKTERRWAFLSMLKR